MGRQNRKRKRDKRGKPESSFEGKSALTSRNFYDRQETKRYMEAGYKTGVQAELTWRALHFLVAPSSRSERYPVLGASSMILDVGVGAGACANVIEACCRQQKLTTPWIIIGTDKSMQMLCDNNSSGVASMRELVCSDFCASWPFRPGVKFDGIISVSALQWLCVNEGDNTRIEMYFSEIARLLRSGGVFVAQFYPTSAQDAGRLLKAAKATPFLSECTVVVDYPHKNKSKRLFFRAIKCWNKQSSFSLQSKLSTVDENDDEGDETPKKSSSIDIEAHIYKRVPSMYCPCAWPHQATCSLNVHLESSSSWHDGLLTYMRKQKVVTADFADTKSLVAVEKKYFK